MSDSLSFDVVVVGAGPAGASAAFELARAGLSAAIVEKAKLPRYKTCGGGLLGRTLKLLPIDVREVVERECFQAELHHHAPALMYSTRRDTPVVSMVMRDRFDFLLTRAAESAGATLLAGAALSELVIEKDQVRLRAGGRAIVAKFVIGADGVMSAVARRAGYPELQRVIPALECELTVPPETWARFTAARFDFGLTPRGYGWVFPKHNRLSVGVLTTRRGACNLNDEYQRYVAALGLDRPLSEERHGFMIPATPRRQLFSRERIFLVGDAAGLADPVTAEGISGAILSGQLAARAIVANAADARSAMARYRRELSTSILSELRIARLLARGLYDFSRMRAWLFARHGQKLSEFMTELVMGRARYSDAVCRVGNYVKLLR